MVNFAPLACVPLLLLAGAGTVQDPAAATKGKELILDVGSHEVSTLIDRVARFLSRNILHNPSETQSATPIDLQEPMRLDPRGAEIALHQLLFTRGLVVLPVDKERNTYECIAMNGQRRGEIPMRSTIVTAEEARGLAQLKTPIIVQIELSNVRANAAAQSLRPFFAQSSNNSLQIGSAGSDSSLLLSGFADVVVQAVDLIQRVDAASAKQIDDFARLADRVKKLEERVAALEK